MADLSTPREQGARGKEARAKVPRAAAAGWKAAADRPDPIAVLEAQAATRVTDLVPIRYGRMMASPFAFFRGSAAIMAADLAAGETTGLQVQLCGDAHLSNFGGFASPERELILDANDFDETLPGPWEWDVKRLAASTEVAARDRGFTAGARRGLVLGLAEEYRAAMRQFAGMGDLDVWYLHLTPDVVQARWGMSVKPKAIKTLEADFAHAYQRDNLRAFERLTRRVNGTVRIVSSPPLVVPVEELVSKEQRPVFEDRIRDAVSRYLQTLQPDRQRLLERYRYVHMARKVVGVGSVGTRTWILLLLGRDADDPLFLQAKEAQASVLEPYLAASEYGNHGQRVVEGQRLMQAASDIFLGWERGPLGLDGRSHDFYVRQLWDWKISADVQSIGAQELMVYARMCAWTLARAHARSGDRVGIAAYLGKSDVYDRALADFAAAYAEQNQRDFQRLVDAVKSGLIEARTGI